jgi:sec-independent protein translocase protein TatC
MKAMTNDDMTLVEHLTELRKRLIWIIVTFVSAFILGFVIAGPVVEQLKMDPIAANISLHAFGPADALRVYMQVAFVSALILTTPVILYHVWAFVAPGLDSTERRALLMYIPFAVLLLILGLAFGYFILFPMVIGFMASFSEALGVQETYGIAQYFSFMFNLIVPVGLIFELPVIVLFLTAIRIINPLVLVKFRKYAIFLAVVIGALITPPDLISNILVAIPMLILYEFSIILSKIVYRRQLRKQQEEEEYALIKTDD